MQNVELLSFFDAPGTKLIFEANISLFLTSFFFIKRFVMSQQLVYISRFMKSAKIFGNFTFLFILWSSGHLELFVHTLVYLLSLLFL